MNSMNAGDEKAVGHQVGAAPAVSEAREQRAERADEAAQRRGDREERERRVQVVQDMPLDMGTLSKALGSYGGYVCASEPVIALLHSRARSFVYSTGLPPASAAAALAALDIMDAEPERCARPRLLARRFAQALHLPDPASAIVPLIVGEAERTLAALGRIGACRIPGGGDPPADRAGGRARLRFTFSAAHSDAQVDALIDAVTNIMSTQTIVAQP